MGEQFDLVLGLRSGSVGVCAFRRGKKDAVPTCLFASRLGIPLQEKFDQVRGLADLARGIEQALNLVRKHVPGHPRSITAVLGTPWYLSQTRKITYKNDSPVTVTQKFLADLLRGEAAAFQSEHWPGREAEVIECATMKILLNGYPVMHPYGHKTVRELELSCYLSMADKDFLAMVRRQVARFYHQRQIRFQTFAFAVWQSLRDSVLASADNFVLLDIGGEVSQWTLVEEAAIVESVTFPLGAHTIIRDLARILRLPIEEARVLYNAYQQARVSPVVEKKIVEVLADVRLKWVTYLKGIIQKFSNNHILPNYYCVIGVPQTGKLFCQILDNPEISSLTSAPSVRSCSLPAIGDLKEFYRQSPAGKPDIFSLLEMLFVDKSLTSV